MSSCNNEYLVFIELRFFSSMFPSMPKGEIVTMNTDGISMVEYPSIVGEMIQWLYVAFIAVIVIDVTTCYSMNIDRVVGKDQGCAIWVLKMKLWAIEEVFYRVSWWCG